MTASEFLKRSSAKCWSGNSYFYVNRVANKGRNLPCQHHRSGGTRSKLYVRYFLTTEREIVKMKIIYYTSANMAPIITKALVAWSRKISIPNCVWSGKTRGKLYERGHKPRKYYILNSRKRHKNTEFKKILLIILQAINSGKTPVLAGGWDFRNNNISLKICSYWRSDGLTAMQSLPLSHSTSHRANHEKNTSWGQELNKLS